MSPPRLDQPGVWTRLFPHALTLMAHLETCAEIIAKKMWHRGDRAKARDLFDLCAVADAQPDALIEAAPFMQRHGAQFLERLAQSRDLVAAEFDAIDAMNFRRGFEECLDQAEHIIRPILPSTTRARTRRR